MPQLRHGRGGHRRPDGRDHAADRLPAWGGALVLLAYAVVFAVLASLTTLRRDIT
ncbi:MAG: hypothetical protein IPO93_03410 [Actinobacteria bacterium]|nr:hypothetical protein [Actinomycetota bacterium]